MSDSLYKISDELKSVIENGFKLDEETGEFWDESDIEALSVTMAEKVEAVSMYALGRRKLAQARKEIAQAMLASSKRLDAEADRLDEYAIRCLKSVGGKVETDAITVSVRKCPPSVMIVNEEAIPPEFIKKKVMLQTDKTAIKNALKSGEEVPGAALVTNERLSIR